jgi:hypothetical protein
MRFVLHSYLTVGVKNPDFRLKICILANGRLFADKSDVSACNQSGYEARGFKRAWLSDNKE